MSTDANPSAPTAWEPLSIVDRRILGVLVEKQKTSKTADSYPLSLNALTTGCNQKSNRDPVLDLVDDEVEEGLSSLQKQGLVLRLTGGRVDRFKHLLYEAWTPNGPQLAVLAELLLRGPQTRGELRGRAGRMDPIDTLDALEDVLRPLIERKLVINLTDPDRRGALVTHGFHTPDELARLRTHAATQANTDTASSPTRATVPAAQAAPAPDAFAMLERRLAEAFAEIEQLKAAVRRLESRGP